MIGNGELTETENVIFYVSYGVLTEFLRMNVILTYFCNGNGLTARIRNAGNQAYVSSVSLCDVTQVRRQSLGRRWKRMAKSLAVCWPLCANDSACIW